MPQVGDIVEDTSQVPDRWAYASAPAYVFVEVPEHEVVVEPETTYVSNTPQGPKEVTLPAVTEVVPAVLGTVPARVLLLREGLTEPEVMDPGSPFHAWLAGEAPAHARGVLALPPNVGLDVGYRFED